MSEEVYLELRRRAYSLLGRILGLCIFCPYKKSSEISLDLGHCTRPPHLRCWGTFLSLSEALDSLPEDIKRMREEDVRVAIESLMDLVESTWRVLEESEAIIFQELDELLEEELKRAMDELSPE